MHLLGIPANSIHWLRELQLYTVGSSYPAIVDCFLAGDRASGHVKGCSIGLRGDPPVSQTRMSKLHTYSQPTGVTSVALVAESASSLSKSCSNNRENIVTT